MPTAMYMDTQEAVNAIGEALVNMGGEEDFQHRRFPAPGFGDVFFEPTLPSILGRWDGFAEDSGTESELIKVASVLRMEIRIIAIADYAPAGITDAYINAQQMVLAGTNIFFTGLAEDRSLGGLVLDSGLESSLIGPLTDPVSEVEYYGHEMVLLTRLFR